MTSKPRRARKRIYVSRVGGSARKLWLDNAALARIKECQQLADRLFEDGEPSASASVIVRLALKKLADRPAR